MGAEHGEPSLLTFCPVDVECFGTAECFSAAHRTSGEQNLRQGPDEVHAIAHAMHMQSPAVGSKLAPL